MLVTSLFFSKLYYGSEVWHLPTRTASQNKQLKYASANALRSCDKSLNIFHTHTEIHQRTERAMPDQILNYKHSLLMYKLMNQCSPDEEFMNLNFQANLNPRLKYQNFIKIQKFNVGNNILVNRLSSLNDKIEKDWLNLSYNTFKLKCKSLFLSN